MAGGIRQARTKISEYRSRSGWGAFTSVASLHAHTHHSREVMADLPRYILQIPVISGCFERATRAYAEREGCEIDFSRGWWHPPVSPRAVFESEAEQIERCFGLSPLVSVTDHDDITAGLDLQLLYANRRAPVSMEWTVPIGNGYFHLGIHNLPPASAREWFGRLSAVTAAPKPDAVNGVLADLAALPDALIVLNHPMWDLAGVGPGQHERLLRTFCHRHAFYLHALEINGYRSWRENAGVRPLARELQLPIVSGGDRHGRDPNAVLNLTRASSFAEFVTELRDGGSEVVIMPEYRRHLATRKLSSAGDVLRRYRSHPADKQRWTDRITWDDGDGARALSTHWPSGGPWWVRSAVGAFRVITSPVVLPVLGAALEASDSVRARTPARAGHGAEVFRLADSN